MKNVIYRIEIPNYPDKIQISKSRRPIYYVSEHSLKRGKKKIPKKYLNERYQFSTSGILYDTEQGIPVIANTKTHGKPRYIVINGQDIWNGKLNTFGRNNITIALKKILYPYFKDLKPIEEFPIGIHKYIFSPKLNIDVDNKSTIYTKVISDLLTELGIIPDDKPSFINENGGLTWIESDENKMIVIIYKSSKVLIK